MIQSQKIIYLAGPLFSMAERIFNRSLKRGLESEMNDVCVILPQDYRIDGRYNAQDKFQELYANCMMDLARADLVIGILDGADADSGACFEIGYAVSSGIPVLAVRTDFREQQEKGVNLMLSRGVTKLITHMAFDENVDALVADIVRYARGIFSSK